MPKAGTVLGLSSFMSCLSRDHCLSLSDVHCVENYLHIFLSGFFSCFGWENKSRFSFSSRAMVEVSGFTDLFNVVILDLQHPA